MIFDVIKAGSFANDLAHVAGHFYFMYHVKNDALFHILSLHPVVIQYGKEIIVDNMNLHFQPFFCLALINNGVREIYFYFIFYFRGPPLLLRILIC